ncbi:hypothetical protein BH11VER1_BH11VER1_13340 [soil metagenome]
MKYSDLKHSGHWPTLCTSLLYFDYSFMGWILLEPSSLRFYRTGFYILLALSLWPLFKLTTH